MALRVTMLCATGAEVSDGLVFGDGALSDHGRREDTATEVVLPTYSLALRAPSACCARAAEALAIAARPDNALRDLDYGSWYGRPRKDIVAEDPYGFSAWLADPDAAPHGGESVARLCRRTAAWLSSLPADSKRILTITEAAVIRASLVHVLSAPAHAFWHLEVPPLSAVTLTMRTAAGMPGSAACASGIDHFDRHSTTTTGPYRERAHASGPVLCPGQAV